MKAEIKTFTDFLKVFYVQMRALYFMVMGTAGATILINTHQPDIYAIYALIFITIYVSIGSLFDTNWVKK